MKNHRQPKCEASHNFTRQKVRTPMKISCRKNARKAAAGIIFVLILLTLAFIWSNSLASQDVSCAKSESAMQYVAPYVEIIVGAGNVTEHLVRKLAHISEFGALGCEFALLCVLRRRLRPQSVVNALFAGLAAAVADEALQILSERGPLVGDILLDFSGCTAGMVFVLCVHALVKRFFGKGRKSYRAK